VPNPARIPFSDVAFRYSDYDTPLWARANTEGGRWHFARTEPTQYFGLSTDACWADLLRHEDLRSEAEAGLVQIPLWIVRLNEEMIADYETFEKAEAAGFPPDALIDEDWERCQLEGERLREEGYRGVLAPAAALPGETALTLFGGRRAIDWSETPVLASAMPARVMTVGAPPPGLVGRVRFHGQAHADYEAYAVARGRRERS
jgi:RES domain-containing protein